MREVVTDELHVLSQPDSLDNSISLLGPKEAKDTVLVNMIWPQAVAGMPRVASSARCQDGTVFAGDVVLFSDERHKWSCGKVKCHLQYGEDRRTVLDRFALQAMHSHHAVWHERDDPVAVPLLEIFTSVVFAKDAGTYTTLIPWRWR